MPQLIVVRYNRASRCSGQTEERCTARQVGAPGPTRPLSTNNPWMRITVSRAKAGELVDLDQQEPTQRPLSLTMQDARTLDGKEQIEMHEKLMKRLRGSPAWRAISES